MRNAFYLPAFALAAILFFPSCSETPTDDGKNAAQDVAGYIVDEQAYRVPNALVELIDATQSVVAIDTTNEDGEFSLSAANIPLSALNMRVTHSDFKPFVQSVVTVVDDGTPTDIALPLEHHEDACGNLSLLVRSNDGLNPLLGVEVRLTRNGALVVKGYTDASGRLDFDYLIAGHYALRFAVDGYKVVEKTFTIEHCDSASFDIRMVARESNPEDSCCHGILTVNVFDSTTNAPISMATVKFFLGQTLKETVKTNEHGIAIIDGICPGDGYQVSVAKDHYVGKEVNMAFLCNEQKSVTVHLLPEPRDTCCEGILSLTIYEDGTTTGISQAQVKLWKSGAVVRSAKTNEHGTLTMDGLCEGEYGISVMREGFKSKELHITFGCNDSKSETVFLTTNIDTCCTASLKLRIIDHGTEAGVSGATVTVKQNESVVYTGTADTEGWMLKEGLCSPASYTVSVSMNGYHSKTFTVTYHECKRIQETIRLVPS